MIKIKNLVRCLLVSTVVTITAPAFSGHGVNVMSPSEAGNMATIGRIKAVKRATEGMPSNNGITNQGCGDLNIGTFQGGAGQRVPSKIVTIVEGPIYQDNSGCK
jgi:hypothetical protein